ncbi:hypothetical protein JCGZ_00571 [Jatropha curcas]|uniref:Glycosyltransferase n=1 Tax=Jatropha curcas TaxID=180498 RepID=A0A067JQI2_JATCU|nr:hypothetical protein JCGZ_00571 [Jatropha curcas]
MPETDTGTAAGRHVVVLAFPFGTHAAPLFSITNQLAILSPNTLFSFLNISKSNKSIFSTNSNNILEPSIKVYDVWDGVPDGYQFLGKPQEDIELFMKAAPESFKKGIMKAVAETGKEVTCLVTDAFFWFGAEMAEEMKVAWMAFWTSSPVSISVHFYTDSIRETFGVEGKAGENETLNLIPGMSKVQIRDLPEGITFGNLESVFSQMSHKMGITLVKADTVFLNSFEELEPVITSDLNSKFNKFLSIGPFNLISPPKPTPDSYGCLDWLQKQRPESVAYISFGSVATPPPHELVALAEALESSKIHFIWSLKEHLKVNLPNGFLERTKLNGIVVAWTPQMEVLANSAIGVFITHCGWNSVMESIVGGVPMICRPFFGDQMLNGRMVEDVWEIGVKVESGILSKTGVIECLNKIFSHEKGKKMRENVKALKELAKSATGPNGSSFKNFTALAELVTRRGKFQPLVG